MKPNIDIDDNIRAEIAALLSKLLADESILSQKTRNAHWNIVGPDFHAMHGFFESQYRAIEESIDEVAERIRQVDDERAVVAGENHQQSPHAGDVRAGHDPAIRIGEREIGSGVSRA